MKKTMRILALIMAMTLAVTMFAGITAGANNLEQQTNGTITITPPTSGNLALGGTYKAYRVFDIFGKVEAGADKFGYIITAEFEDFDNSDFIADSAFDSLFEFLNEGKFENNSEEMDALAEALRAYILEMEDEDTGDPDYFKDVLETETPSGNPPVVKFTGLPLGYYIVLGTGIAGENGDEVVVALAALTTTKPDAEFVLKADAPVIEKWVMNDHEEEWAKWNDTSIGEEVEFRFVSTVPARRILREFDVYKYVIHDQMSAGLSLPLDFVANGVQMYINAERDTAGSVLVPPRYYTVSVAEWGWDLTDPLNPVRLNEGSVFAIDVNLKALVEYFADDEDDENHIDVTSLYTYYKAELNEFAIIELKGNPNKVQLEYSNNPYDGESKTYTPWYPVIVYTGAFSFIKVDADTGEGLPGAVFNLFRADEDGKYDADDPIKFIKIEDIEDIKGQIEFDYDDLLDEYTLFDEAAVYMVSTSAEAEADIVTDVSGKVVFIGLGASAWNVEEEKFDDLGNYILKEITPPDGYYSLGEDIAIQLRIAADLNGHLLEGGETEWGYVYGLLTEGNWDELFGDLAEIIAYIPVIDPLFVENHSFVGEFPGTGSMGETVLFIGSMLLMGVSIIGLLIFATKGRRRANKSRS